MKNLTEEDKKQIAHWVTHSLNISVTFCNQGSENYGADKINQEILDAKRILAKIGVEIKIEKE